MRFTSSSKFVLGLFASFAVIFFAIFYGYNRLSDQTLKFIEDYAGAVFIIVIFVPIGYILFSYVTTNANEYAEGIFEIFLDSNDKDIHVFSYNRIIAPNTRGGATRLIQHYFIVADTGKSYYKVLFSHSMDSKDGVLEGFESFGKSVLQGHELKDRFKELSKETGFTPDLGEILRKDANDLYKIGDHRALRIDKVEKLYSRQLAIAYMDADSKKVLWKNKI